MDKQEAKEYMDLIQSEYDMHGYVSTNHADQLIEIANNLIKEVETLEAQFNLAEARLNKEMRGKRSEAKQR